MEEKKGTHAGLTTVVGRRKEAVAKIRLSAGQGVITVNGKPIVEYFAGAIFQRAYNKPMEVTNTIGKYTISAKIEGGGQVSQLGALVHGIARAIAKAEPELRTPLKKEGLLTRDARVRERRKYGLAGKARAKKQSPKR
ncbi:30S ribosomal protein S9 [Candidatus Daviesbacteria bacterium RIFCSPHIGHO2_02_FULL_36_13]|uniref:30S ribosomal protein S9 n=1 Tax=Candidatus Daviesbacteria bacterium RIFCSPHIGHO2_02_FULL_36_13 TaxID=1797768 RepID=A0A1F5JYZ7_9BACT|nr:MAG: 30S ribosomal protein S9 [Candidatus Daviesbacteria bacterium RIFCSPHIGHO2_02_FULL_36_13]